MVDFADDRNGRGHEKFFEEYGFVVMRGVLTEAECEATLDNSGRKMA